MREAIRSNGRVRGAPDEGGNQRSSEVIRDHPSLGGPRRPSRRRDSCAARDVAGAPPTCTHSPRASSSRRSQGSPDEGAHQAHSGALRQHSDALSSLMRALIRRTQAALRQHSVHKCHEDHKVPVAVRLHELIIRRNQRSSVALTLFRSQCALMSSFVSL